MDLQIVQGDPTPEELTALVAVLVTAPDPGPEATVAPAPRSAWGAPASLLRRPLERGPGAWRRSLQF